MVTCDVACRLLRVLLVLLLCAERCVAVKWLALYRVQQRQWDRPGNCSKSTGLAKTQLKLCRNNLDLMSTVVGSAIISVETCQRQFADRRWNCSSILHVPKLTNDLLNGTREQAYVYGIASSALVHSISRACSIGVTTKCSCGKLPGAADGTNFKWGGCGDNIQFGKDFGESFTEATLRSKKGGKGKKAMMNRHNFRVGREIVTSSLTQACKCHGVSGSCQVKTCWKSLQRFSDIGAQLKEKYRLAVEVRRKRRRRNKADKEKVLVPIHKNRKSFRSDELVYYKKSPDYCSPDRKTGSVGTKGRICQAGSRGPGNCGSMCCGRGYTNFTVEKKERCECKYIWCCFVKCKTCTKTLRLSKCK